MGSQMQRSCPPNSLRFISGALLSIPPRHQGHQRGISELEKRQAAHFKDLILKSHSNGPQKHTHTHTICFRLPSLMSHQRKTLDKKKQKQEVVIAKIQFKCMCVCLNHNPLFFLLFHTHLKSLFLGSTVTSATWLLIRASTLSSPGCPFCCSSILDTYPKTQQGTRQEAS